MSDTDIKALFAAAPEEPVPPQEPDYVARVVQRGRRSHRRRMASLGALWTIVAAAVLAIAVPGVPPDLRPAAPARQAEAASLPDRFAGYSLLTAPVSRDAPGRVVALYTYGNGELFNMFQPLVVGAYGDIYRRVDAMQERGTPSSLLSPDGTKLLIGDDRGATSYLLMLDLVTGRERRIDIGAPTGVRLLAWSPDGRYVAYSVAPVAPSGLATSNLVDYEVSRNGTLVVLDVGAGTGTRIDGLKPVWRAAFSPDSQRLAVQVGQTAHLVDRSGREDRRLTIPAGLELAGGVAWSPDGALLAVHPWLADGPASGATGQDTFSGPDREISFLDATGTGRPTPPPVAAYELLGWRSATAVLTWSTTGDYTGGGTISEVRLGGQPRTLATFGKRKTCELGAQPCQVFNVQLATALVPQLTVRDAGFPRRGWWPWWLIAVLGATVVTVALALRPKRRRPPAPASAPAA